VSPPNDQLQAQYVVEVPMGWAARNLGVAADSGADGCGGFFSAGAKVPEGHPQTQRWRVMWAETTSPGLRPAAGRTAAGPVGAGTIVGGATAGKPLSDLLDSCRRTGNCFVAQDGKPFFGAEGAAVSEAKRDGVI